MVTADFCVWCRDLNLALEVLRSMSEVSEICMVRNEPKSLQVVIQAENATDVMRVFDVIRNLTCVTTLTCMFRDQN